MNIVCSFLIIDDDDDDGSFSQAAIAVNGVHFVSLSRLATLNRASSFVNADVVGPSLTTHPLLWLARGGFQWQISQALLLLGFLLACPPKFVLIEALRTQQNCYCAAISQHRSRSSISHLAFSIQASRHRASSIQEPAVGAVRPATVWPALKSVRKQLGKSFIHNGTYRS